MGKTSHFYSVSAHCCLLNVGEGGVGWFHNITTKGSEVGTDGFWQIDAFCYYFPFQCVLIALHREFVATFKIHLCTLS